MSVTGTYLKDKIALSKLSGLSTADIQNTLNKLQSLADNNVLTQSEVDQMKLNFKTNLNSSINQIISDATNEGGYLADAAECEVYDKVKGATPLISGVVVMANPTIEISSANETTFLNNVSSLTNNLTTLQNNLNAVLS